MSRRKFTSKFKTKVVLEALKERDTIAKIAQKYEIHPQQITNWKREFLGKAEDLFEGKLYIPAALTPKFLQVDPQASKWLMKVKKGVNLLECYAISFCQFH